MGGANSMAMSGLGHEKPLVGAGYVFPLVLSVNRPRKQSSHLAILVFEADLSARVS